MKKEHLQPIEVLRPGGGAWAVITLVDHEGMKAVLKDFSRSSWWFRNSCGALLSRRESAAYRRTQGIQGVPRFLGRVGRHGLLMKHIAGRNCLELPAGHLTPAFFERLREILRSIQERGVVHCDVARNVLQSAEGSPVLIDFAASFVIPRWAGPLRNILVEWRRHYDERAVVKLKKRTSPHLLSWRDQEILQKAPPLEGLVDLVEGVFNCGVRWIIRLLAR